MRALGSTWLVAACALLSTACLDPGRAPLETKDSVPPTLVSTDPPAGSTLDTTATIQVTFSEHMDPRSLRPGLFLMAGDTPVATSLEIPPEPVDTPDAVQQTDVAYTVRVSGTQPLHPNTSYTLVFDPVLTDTEGNPIASPDGGTSGFGIGFRTRP